MRDPREIYPGEPISSIMNRLSGHGQTQARRQRSIPISGWLFVAFMVGIPAFGIAMLVIDSLIDRGFFG